jgi:hypothetical protein
MWSRLDDELIDHAKVFAAGKVIGKNGPAVALGFYTVGLMWANKHLTDGFLPMAVVTSFPHVANPAAVADALVRAGLWDKNGGSGFQIHDFADHNLSAAAVKSKRREDRKRKRQHHA